MKAPPQLDSSGDIAIAQDGPVEKGVNIPAHER